jgi:hypothetical protein
MTVCFAVMLSSAKDPAFPNRCVPSPLEVSYQCEKVHPRALLAQEEERVKG